MIFKLYNFTKLVTLKKLNQQNYTKNFKKSKDMYNYFFLKKSKSRLFKIFKKFKKKKRKVFLDNLKLIIKKTKRKSFVKIRIKKIFKNKSYKNIRKNFFVFKNNYHKFKNNSINII